MRCMSVFCTVICWLADATLMTLCCGRPHLLQPNLSHVCSQMSQKGFDVVDCKAHLCTSVHHVRICCRFCAGATEPAPGMHENCKHSFLSQLLTKLNLSECHALPLHVGLPCAQTVAFVKPAPHVDMASQLAQFATQRCVCPSKADLFSSSPHTVPAQPINEAKPTSLCNSPVYYANLVLQSVLLMLTVQFIFA